MYTKTKVANLTLNALLMTKQISNIDTDESVEGINLRFLSETAIEMFAEECDLNELKTTADLTLVATEPNDKWLYAYNYPEDCALFRRIDSGYLKDTKDTMVLKEVGIYNGEKVIFTNKQDAVGEYISTEDIFVGLSASSANALAQKWAMLAVPLIAMSTDPNALSKTIEKRYEYYKSLAQQKDAKENFLPDLPEDESDISRARFS